MMMQQQFQTAAPGGMMGGFGQMSSNDPYQNMGGYGMQ
jgi:hypothetical protein